LHADCLEIKYASLHMLKQ